MSVDLWNQLYNTVLNEWLWPLYSAETRTIEVKIEIRSLSSFMKLMYVCVLSHVRLFATTWTIAHQSPLSMDSSGLHVVSTLASLVGRRLDIELNAERCDHLHEYRIK